MGDARVIVAERHGRVLGTLGVAVRELALPGGTRRSAAYLGDLKVDPAARSSTTLGRLIRAADAWAWPRVSAVYAVVMDGTAVAPAGLTGRLNIPTFEPLATVRVLRLPTDASMPGGPACFCGALPPDPMAVTAHGGDPRLRSSIRPEWIATPDAAGRLEDTAAAKRLVGDDGVELRSAHLARFTWRSHAEAEAVATEAEAVVTEARRRAAALASPPCSSPCPATCRSRSTCRRAPPSPARRCSGPACRRACRGRSTRRKSDTLPRTMTTTDAPPIAPHVSAAAGAVLARAGLLSNAYFTALADGSMSLDGFRRGQEQFFYAVQFYARPIAALAARVPDPADRLDLVHNLVEEHGDFREPQFHQNTFRQFLATVGARRPGPATVLPGPAVHAFNAALMGACTAEPPDVGICCLGIIEQAFAGASAPSAGPCWPAGGCRRPSSWSTTACTPSWTSSTPPSSSPWPSPGGPTPSAGRRSRPGWTWARTCSTGCTATWSPTEKLSGKPVWASRARRLLREYPPCEAL